MNSKQQFTLWRFRTTRKMVKTNTSYKNFKTEKHSQILNSQNIDYCKNFTNNSRPNFAKILNIPLFVCVFVCECVFVSVCLCMYVFVCIVAFKNRNTNCLWILNHCEIFCTDCNFARGHWIVGKSVIPSKRFREFDLHKFYKFKRRVWERGLGEGRLKMKKIEEGGRSR